MNERLIKYLNEIFLPYEDSYPEAGNLRFRRSL